VVTEAKKKEADRYILSSRKKNKALWKLINREIGKTQQSCNIVINFRDKTITNPQIVSDRFNTFFIEVIDKLLSQKNQPFFKKDLKLQIKKCAETMFVSPVTETEMERVIKSLKNNSSVGFDEIHVSSKTEFRLFYKAVSPHLQCFLSNGHISRYDETGKNNTSL
jgi:hypothetical protein